MEEKIYVAEILKDKPEGTKLYSPICGECKLSYVKSVKSEPQISTESDAFGVFYFWDDGKAYNEGECLLFPSSEMRDWGKFTYKKGDVLVNKDGDVHIIFERFADDTYCSFVGKYYLWKENNDTEHFYKNERLLTSDFQKAGKDAAQTYISNIEERLGGKLNRETLEIEKTQPEFKDGDILSCDEDSYTKHTTLIFHKNGDTRESIVSLIRHKELVEANEHINDFLLSRLNYAREDEKKELFNTLAKKGKTWDAEKKAIVDLKPKCEFKPFDKVLSRRCSEDYWVLNFYSHKTDYYHVCIDGSSNLDCIPYNEETAHLLGTTDEWKGGKQ